MILISYGVQDLLRMLYGSTVVLQNTYDFIELKDILFKGIGKDYSDETIPYSYIFQRCEYANGNDYGSDSDSRMYIDSLFSLMALNIRGKVF